MSFYWGRGAWKIALVLTLIGTLILLWNLIPGAPGPSDVRISNETGFPLRGVQVNGITYGDIAPGNLTPYLQHHRAPRCPRFSFSIDRGGGNWVGIVGTELLSDPPGRLFLGAGRFTYVVRLRQPGDLSDLSVCVQDK